AARVGSGRPPAGAGVAGERAGRAARFHGADAGAGAGAGYAPEGVAGKSIVAVSPISSRGVMKIGVPKETAANERRVALVPDAVARLVKAGLEVAVEQGAGAGAAFPDDAYRAAGAGLLAATTAGRLFPMLVTAAGTLAPARVLVLGAGVAGLQAIATARRLGAVVSAFDVRPAVKEQVESLGAKFLQLEIAEQAETAGGYAKQLSEEMHRRELAFIAQHVKDADVVITTAAIPGKRAPLLITADAVRGMKPGAVIVDLAAETGGNCEVTEPGKDVRRDGVVILGPLNLPSTVPLHASQMYARNIASFLMHVVREGRLNLDFSDEIIRETCVTHAGEIRKP